MSYIVKQKIGNHIYAYEAESYYDKEKKQPRQRRRYLGRVDPLTGEIVETSRTKTKHISLPKSAKSIGAVHLFDGTAERIGLKEALKETFPDKWKEILSISFFELSECKPLYLFKEWVEDTYISFMKEHTVSSQSISKLLKSIGEQDRRRGQFFINWISHIEDTKSIIFDITSVSSYSNSIDSVERGYNRDKEDLPQINIGMVFGEPSSLPLFYSLYPGSIPDIVTLKNIIIRLNSFGVKDISFVMDRGFYSKHNIELLCKNSIDFIVPISFTTKVSKELLSKHMKDLSSTDNFFLYENRVIFSIKDSIKIGNNKLTAFIYADEKRKSEEVQRFLIKVGEVEREVQFHSFNSREEVKEFIESYRKGMSKYFSIEVKDSEVSKKIEDKKNRNKREKDKKEKVAKQIEFVLIRKKTEIEKAINRMGKMILITNRTDLNKEQVLSLYKRRNEVERLFNILKNEMDGNRIRNHSNETMEGKLFILFVTLALYASLDRTMKEKELYKTVTLHELIYELKKIKVVETSDNHKFLTEISKKQREIYEKFNIPLPKLEEREVT